MQDKAESQVLKVKSSPPHHVMFFLIFFFMSNYHKMLGQLGFTHAETASVQTVSYVQNVREPKEETERRWWKLQQM